MTVRGFDFSLGTMLFRNLLNLIRPVRASALSVFSHIITGNSWSGGNSEMILQGTVTS